MHACLYFYYRTYHGPWHDRKPASPAQPSPAREGQGQPVLPCSESRRAIEARHGFSFQGPGRVQCQCVRVARLLRTWLTLQCAGGGTGVARGHSLVMPKGQKGWHMHAWDWGFRRRRRPGMAGDRTDESEHTYGAHPVSQPLRARAHVPAGSLHWVPPGLARRGTLFAICWACALDPLEWL